VRRVAIVLSLVILNFASLAQRKTKDVVDSLENLLTQSLPDSQRLRAINYLVFHYNDVNTDRFIELSEEALRLVGSTRNKWEIGTVYLNMGLATESKGEYMASLAYNAKALQVFQALGDSASISSILNNIGIAYNQIGDYSMAVYYLLKAIEIDEARKDLAGAGTEYINLAESYYNAKSYPTALRWARKAHYQLEKIDRHTMGYAAELLAIIYVEVGKYDSVKYFLSISKDIGNAYNNEYLIVRSLGHLGRMHLKMKNYDSAQYYLVKAIQENKGKNLSDVLLPATLSLTRIFIAQGKYKEALSQAKWVYSSSLEIKNKVIALESCELIASVYEVLNQKDEAIHYFKLAAGLRQEMLEQSLQASLHAKSFDIILEKEKREKQAAVYSLEQSGKVLVRQRYLLVTGSIVVVVLLTLLYLLRKINLERKKANMQLTQNNLQLNKLNQEINGLIHTIVHDLKSPLNTMQGILMVLETETKDNPACLELIKHGHKTLSVGHEITRELLELRELEEKSVSLQLETTSLKLFVDHITSEYMMYARQKDIALTATAPDVDVIMDKQLVKRLITNLVSNAIKFSPKGKPVTVTALATEKNIIFEIIDEGPGFRPSDLEKIYSKFQRLSATPTGGESSHGLGLAIVDLLVKQLNATIDLKTEWGKGSAFTITVPVVG
jgi:signal transduction histidine kinase